MAHEVVPEVAATVALRGQPSADELPTVAVRGQPSADELRTVALRGQPSADELRTVALRGQPSADGYNAAIGQRVTVLDEAKGAAVLTVRRTAGDDVQDRQVYLSVDGEDWVTLYYGQSVTRELPPGRHTLKANNTLVRKAVTFDVRPGEHVRFQCINRAHWTGMLFMAFLGAAVLTVRLEREPAD